MERLSSDKKIMSFEKMTLELHLGQTTVRKLDLSQLCFFFELLFSYVSLAISFYVSPANLFSIILFFICQLPKTLKTKEKPDFDSTNTGTV